MEDNVKLNEILYLQSTLNLVMNLICLENDERQRLELYNHHLAIRKELVINVRDYIKEDQTMLSRFDEEVFKIELIEMLVLRNIMAF